MNWLPRLFRRAITPGEAARVLTAHRERERRNHIRKTTRELRARLGLPASEYLRDR